MIWWLGALQRPQSVPARRMWAGGPQGGTAWPARLPTRSHALQESASEHGRRPASRGRPQAEGAPRGGLFAALGLPGALGCDYTKPAARRGSAPLPCAPAAAACVLPCDGCCPAPCLRRRAAASVSPWSWRTACRAGSLSRCQQTRRAPAPRNVSSARCNAAVGRACLPCRGARALLLCVFATAGYCCWAAHSTPLPMRLGIPPLLLQPWRAGWCW